MTGKPLSGWAHCVQSISVILTTRIGSRVMRRAFGSLVPELQDRNATPLLIMQVYAAVAAALRAYEPGFRLRTIQLSRFGADGIFAFEISGIFYPRGHLGDYSISEARSAVLAANDNGFRMMEVA
ncbi:GPW/gp25 family protein [Bosea sp. CRIB-10]|uniref:GPW/gp25 family protein n=1 Tax=Bosea sp. CRIB-10 TaxID=378404 RepID=UPI001FCCEE19|nr:GPW/gp25 family protein [Bosea sp. CRIB-10]